MKYLRSFHMQNSLVNYLALKDVLKFYKIAYHCIVLYGIVLYRIALYSIFLVLRDTLTEFASNKLWRGKEYQTGKSGSSKGKAQSTNM